MLYIALRTESNRGPAAKRRFPKDVFVIMPHQRDAGFHRINLDHTHRFGMSVALLMCSLRPAFEWFGRYRYVLFVCQFASWFHYEDLMMLMPCDVGRVHTHMWIYKYKNVCRRSGEQGYANADQKVCNVWECGEGRFFRASFADPT